MITLFELFNIIALEQCENKYFNIYMKKMYRENVCVNSTICYKYTPRSIRDKCLKGTYQYNDWYKHTKLLCRQVDCTKPTKSFKLKEHEELYNAYCKLIEYKLVGNVK